MWGVRRWGSCFLFSFVAARHTLSVQHFGMLDEALPFVQNARGTRWACPAAFVFVHSDTAEVGVQQLDVQGSDVVSVFAMQWQSLVWAIFRDFIASLIVSVDRI